MSSINKIKLSVVIVFVFSVATTIFAQQQKEKLHPPAFYQGPVGIQRVAGTLELQQGDTPTAQLEVEVRNNSQSQKNVSIGFRGSELVNVSLEPRATHELTLSTKSLRSGNPEGGQNVRIDLVLLIDGMLTADPIEVTDIKILLPQSVPALIRSNMPLAKDTEGDITTYRLTRQNTYLTELNLVYTLGSVTVSIDKNIQPNVIDKAGPVNITLTIRNLGREDARNVLLEDNFDPRDFSGEGEGFELYTGEENDSRLLWSQTIDQIPVGGTVSLMYTVNALMPVHGSSLSAVTASIGSELVGVSNKIRLGSSQQ